MTIYIGGITIGKNIPLGRTLDLSRCKNLIFVDTKYFLNNIEEIKQFAEEFSSD